MLDEILVSFGEYLFSKEREDSIKATNSDIPTEERMKMIHLSDLENFKIKQENKKK